ncbi:MAG: thioredoxin 1 [Bacteroidia bacterium]|jgi:thioredoxin 1
MRNRIFLSSIVAVLFVGLTFSSCSNKTQSTNDKIEAPISAQSEESPESNSEAVNISTADYNTLISSQPFVVVDFHAVWCRPCLQMAPHLEKIAGEYADTQFKLIKIDVDKNQALSAELGIKSMPTLKLYKDGVEVNTRIGGLNEADLRSLFQPYF